jgi:hypothetical protein
MRPAHSTYAYALEKELSWVHPLCVVSSGTLVTHAMNVSDRDVTRMCTDVMKLSAHRPCVTVSHMYIYWARTSQKQLAFEARPVLPERCSRSALSPVQVIVRVVQPSSTLATRIFKSENVSLHLTRIQKAPR